MIGTWTTELAAKRLLNLDPAHAEEAQESGQQMAAERFYIHRCGKTDFCALTSAKSETRLPQPPSLPGWAFWMQVTRHQVEEARFGFAFDTAISRIQVDGYYLFTGTATLFARPNTFPLRGSRNPSYET